MDTEGKFRYFYSKCLHDRIFIIFKYLCEFAVYVIDSMVYGFCIWVFIFDVNVFWKYLFYIHRLKAVVSGYLEGGVTLAITSIKPFS